MQPIIILRVHVSYVFYVNYVNSQSCLFYVA